ncbi:hypothetical protein ABZ543_08460 [Streptomyces roseifaciens]
MTRRPYCRCTTVRNYDYTEAAEKLRCKARWLEDNISRLPHQKLGQSPAFCDCELALIQGMFSVMPAGLLDLATAGDGHREQETEPENVLALTAIRPSGARRRSLS